MEHKFRRMEKPILFGKDGERRAVLLGTLVSPVGLKGDEFCLASTFRGWGRGKTKFAGQTSLPRPLAARCKEEVAK